MILSRNDRAASGNREAKPDFSKSRTTNSGCSTRLSQESTSALAAGNSPDEATQSRENDSAMLLEANSRDFGQTF